jgi:hypothetical protein
VAAITSSRTPAKIDTNDRFSSRKKNIYYRVSGNKTEGIRVSVKVVTSASATIITGTITGVDTTTVSVRW